VVAGPQAPSVDGTTIDDRREVGRSRRAAVPRSSLAELVVPTRDPVAAVLADDTGRDADLVPVRHHRMSASAFTFYRGSAGLMAGDLAAGTSTGLTVQLCGDAHLSNFGLFATPERRLTFDLNDFDETHPGPWEWDLKRLAASVHLAAAAAGHTPEEIERSVRSSAQAYRRRMALYAETRTLDVWYDAVDLDTSLPSVRRAENRRILEGVMDRARRRTGERAGTGSYRYCPVATRSMDRPPAGSASSPRLIRVRMYTIRSPFLPEIFAQSSGLVVLGRSSCSLYSWWIEARGGRRCGCRGTTGDLALDGQLLGPAHDVLDHGARREVLEVHDLLVAVLVGDLEELVLLVVAVHLVHGGLDHGPHALLGVPRRGRHDGRRRAAVR
jgi:hypothetical protein